MKNMLDRDTTQIEITNACVLKCSNCTRFCGHFKEPFFLTFDQFKEAIDSMVGFPKMVGFQGGEPLIHPEFEKFCKYARSVFPKEKLGLWTTLPRGKEHYREIICETFHHIFINDHSKNDVMHQPVLVAVEELIPDKDEMWYAIEHCWAQEAWSASINPKGAYFCEIAASRAMLFGGSDGWKVEPGWWKRTVKDFREQIEEFCPGCGFACPSKRRASTEDVDDISPGIAEKLKGKSKFVDQGLDSGRFVVHNLERTNWEKDPWDMQSYKDFEYRNSIAHRYGMFLYINESNFWTPCLSEEFDLKKIALQRKPLLEVYKERQAKS